MKEVSLTSGYIAIVDDEDFEYLNQFKWYLGKNRKYKYAVRSIAQKGKNAKTIFMHRVILNVADSKIIVDHIDHDGLNNQKKNLRLASKSQNSKNRKSAYNSTSKYLGVFLNESERGYKDRIIVRKKKWCARISINKKSINLGRFLTESEAAIAYNEAAKKHHGEFANLNIID